MRSAHRLSELASSEETIERELAEVKHRIAILRDTWRPEEWEGGGDNTPFNEAVDALAAMDERDAERDQMARLIERAGRLEDALQRVADGTYGTCLRCGLPIDPRRLHALPEARHCIHCEESLTIAP